MVFLLLFFLSGGVFRRCISGGVFLLRVSGSASFFPAVPILCKFGNLIIIN